MRIFLVISRLDASGPSKGLLALANGLKTMARVTIVSLREIDQTDFRDYRDIEIVSLSDGLGGMVQGRMFLAEETEKCGGSVYIGYSLYADLYGLLCPRRVIQVSYIRANNSRNYRFTYGSWLGAVLYRLHSAVLKKKDGLICLTEVMRRQVTNDVGKEAVVIRNFIDEEAIDREEIMCHSKENNMIRMGFVGNLSKRKRPWLVVRTVAELISQGYIVQAYMLGEGKEEKALKTLSREMKTERNVKFFGFIEKPLEMIASFDVLVLPSVSEGCSRAVLEALFLGVPVVLSNVDGNSELGSQDEGIFLFNSVDQIGELVLKASQFKGKNGGKSLLPVNSRQIYSCNLLREYIDGLVRSRARE